MDGGNESRLLKERFVTGHAGTSHWEVLMVCLVMPLLALPASKISRRLGQRSASHVAEFSLIMVPTLWMTTEILSPALWLAISSICFGVAATFSLLQLNDHQNAVALADLAMQRRRYLDTFRGVMLAYTCLAILAVDFHVFPRRFAKAETFGTGLMDIGPGVFVLASGVVAKPASNQSLYRLMRRAGPLILIGCARLFSVSAADYQVHVGEYGVHWNFFFTLAALEILSCLAPLKGIAALVGAIVTLIAHQSILSLGGMLEYIHAEERGPSLLALNKEGIFSILGYWSIQLWGASCGQGLLWTARKSLDGSTAGKRNDSSARKRASKVLATWTAGLVCLVVALYGCAWVLMQVLEPVSRRACNASYIIWTLGLSLCVILVSLVGDLLGSRPLLLHTLSKNLLGVFLGANLATGCVNLVVNTMDISDLLARGIIGVYMALVCCVGWLIAHFWPA